MELHFQKPVLKSTIFDLSIVQHKSRLLNIVLQVANHIGSDHSEVIVQLDDAINVMEDVVYTTETYDVFNLRSSVGNNT